MNHVSLVNEHKEWVMHETKKVDDRKNKKANVNTS